MRKRFSAAVPVGRAPALQQCVPEFGYMFWGNPDLPRFPRFLARTQNRDVLLLPGNLGKLQMCEIGNGDPGAFENIARLGTGQAESGEFVADVGDLDIVGDDVAIEQLQDVVALPAFGIHQ